MSYASKIYLRAALTRHGGNRSDIRDVLSQDDSKSGGEMPIDVTVKEPWTRVVSLHEYKLSERLSENSIYILTSKRIVTLSPALPRLTTSRCTGFT